MAPRKQVFGQTIQKGNANKQNYRRQFGGQVYRPTGNETTPTKSNDASKADYRRMKQARGEAFDKRFGMEKFALDGDDYRTADHDKKHQPKEKRGWLFNVLPTTVSCSLGSI